MPDFIIRTGDMIKVTIPKPTVIPLLEAPVALTGSSTDVTAVGAPVCLAGDELPASLRDPLPYTAPPFTNPGTGNLTLQLQPANLTQQTKNGKPILIKGQQFAAAFIVATPATQSTPAGPVADPVAAKPGTAEFITTNETVKAG